MNFRVLSVSLMLGLAPAAAIGATGSLEQQYKAAVKLEVSGDIVGALAAFEAISPSDYATKLHIASCKRKLGRFLDAERDYESIATDPNADSATRDTAASDLDDLRTRIPKLRLRFSAGTSGVIVTIDGTAVKVPGEHRTNPGAHEVVGKRGNSVVYERRVNLAESSSIEVEIDAPGAAHAGPPGQKETPPAPPPTSTPPSTTIGPLPFYVGGGILAAGSVVSFVLASSAQDSVKDHCASQQALACDTDAAGASRMRTWETIGWMTGGAAVAAIGVGIVIHVRGREPATTAPMPSVVRPIVGALNGLVWEGRF